MNAMPSQIDQARSLAYLRDHLTSSLLFHFLPPGVFERGAVELVSSSDAPDGCNFQESCGADWHAAEDWLAAEILAHLRADERNTAVIEDAVAAPSDPGLADGAPGQPWFFADRVLWPISGKLMEERLIRQALSWGDPRRIVAFGQGSWFESTAGIVSEDFLRRFGDTIVRFAVDAFDGEALLVWRRRS